MTSTLAGFVSVAVCITPPDITLEQGKVGSPSQLLQEKKMKILAQNKHDDH